MQAPGSLTNELKRLLSIAARYRQMAREIADDRATQALLALASEIEADVAKVGAQQGIDPR